MNKERINCVLFWRPPSKIFNPVIGWLAIQVPADFSIIGRPHEGCKNKSVDMLFSELSIAFRKFYAKMPAFGGKRLDWLSKPKSRNFHAVCIARLQYDPVYGPNQPLVADFISWVSGYCFPNGLAHAPILTQLRGE